MRVFVTGPTGSGKTTIAAAIARHMEAPLYSLDDLHWERLEEGDRRRDPAARQALLTPLVNRPSWVIEGVQFKWADEAIQRADLVLVLDLPRWRNHLRILRRYLIRRHHGASKARRSGSLAEEFGWCADYHAHERALLLDKLAANGVRTRVCRSSRAAWSAFVGADPHA